MSVRGGSHLCSQRVAFYVYTQIDLNLLRFCVLVLLLALATLLSFCPSVSCCRMLHFLALCLRHLSCYANVVTIFSTYYLDNWEWNISHRYNIIGSNIYLATFLLLCMSSVRLRCDECLLIRNYPTKYTVKQRIVADEPQSQRINALYTSI